MPRATTAGRTARASSSPRPRSATSWPVAPRSLRAPTRRGIASSCFPSRRTTRSPCSTPRAARCFTPSRSACSPSPPSCPADGSTAWVSVLGGPKPKSGERAAKQCCDPRAESVRVDARGIAERGTVARVDLVSGRVVGIRHRRPAPDRPRVGRGAPPSVRRQRQLGRRQRRRHALQLRRRDDRRRSVPRAPDRHRADRGRPRRQRPAALRHPRRRERRRRLRRDAAAVCRRASAGSFPPAGIRRASTSARTDAPSPSARCSGWARAREPTHGLRGRYVHAVRGSVNVIDVPTDAQLDAYTTSVAQNNRRHARDVARAVALDRRASGVAPSAVPERPGEPSPIQHVVYIIRENRTYDQILGDHRQGRERFVARDVRPRRHAERARALRAVRHCSITSSRRAATRPTATTGSRRRIETDYPMWPLYYGRSYPSEGVDALTYSSGGFLWEAARVEGEDRHRVRRVRAVDPGAEGRAPHAAPRAVPRLAAARSGVLPRRC